MNKSKTRDDKIEDDEESLRCFLCQIECSRICHFCERVYYCSEKHYELHRFENKTCFPYRASFKNGIGRILIATRTIKPMELVLIDPGTVIGPNYCSTPVCIECLSPIKGKLKCHCQYPICSEECDSLKARHSMKECEILSRRTERPPPLNFSDDPSKSSNAYSLVTPLRMLFLLKSNSDEWKRTNQLMDHKIERKIDMEEWNWYQRNVVQFLLHDLKLASHFDEDETNHAIGLLNVNAVALQFPQTSTMSRHNREGKGLYPIFAIMSHYCICNARYYIHPETFHMFVRARCFIKAGEEISVQYLSALDGNFIRRRKIKKDWYFDCTCSRCKDPTERGSFVSAIYCDSCLKGLLLPKNSLDYDSLWQCSLCDNVWKASSVSEFVESIQEELADISSSGEFYKYEQFITKYSSTLLHPNHFLLMIAKRNLIQYWTYGITNETLPSDKLDMKQRLCQEFLQVLNKIDPGYSELRNFMQKEFNFSKLSLCKSKYDLGLISKEEYMVKSRQSLAALDEVERNKKIICSDI